VAEQTWLGLAHLHSEPPVGPERRHLVDRKAAARAEQAALSASGLGAKMYVVSRSHTQGIGAAVVARVGVRPGVDLVPIDRVSERHAAGMLCPAEWAGLEPHSRIRPALAWGIKEAAAKATGEPLKYFPDGLLIDTGPLGIVVRFLAEPRTYFVPQWAQFGNLLCIWVLEGPRLSRE
jgi:hypothetical protein